MVDIVTYNKLSSEEKDEYKKYGPEFIQAVFKSNATDGIDFANRYTIQSDGDYWFVTEEGINISIGQIKTKSKAVIEILWADAAQNYGR